MTQDNGYDLEHPSPREESPVATLPWDSITTDAPMLQAFEEADAAARPELPAIAHDEGFFVGPVVPVKTDSIAFEPKGVGFLREIKPRAAMDAMAAKGSPIWTIPLMCAGLSLIAACMIVPAADQNRHLAWERERLRLDLEQVQQQVEVNNSFLDKMRQDPALAERLAQRQLRVVREGSTAIHVDGDTTFQERSPFSLIQVPDPEPLPAYQPIGNKFAALCRNPRTQLYLTAAALFMLAVGLVLGGTSPKKPQVAM